MVILFFMLIMLSVAYSSSSPSPTVTEAASNTVDLMLSSGFVAEKLPYQFQEPTQFTIANDILYVAQLNGGENEKAGQIIRIDLGDDSHTILAEQLDKPTGVAILNDMLWIATRGAILRRPLAGGSSLETVLADLPNNGRSNGTLTVTGRETLLYETSGNRRDPDTGKLWELDPETLTTSVLATELKGAYAHAIDADGRIWFTEIADGRIGGETAPDELNLLQPDADYGWPRCYGRELTGPDCSNVRPTTAVFPPHSTPTSVTISPFAPNTLQVALWVEGEVAQAPVTHVGDNAVGDPEAFLSGVDRPQQLLAASDGALWISDYTLP
jgi:glucose/arabinose dehydrogenase